MAGGRGRSRWRSIGRGAACQVWAFLGAGLFNAPGSLGWVELLTRAPERAASFYTTVFGWSLSASEHYPQWGIDGADFGGMVRMDVADVEGCAATATDAGGGVRRAPGGRRALISAGAGRSSPR